MRNNYISINRNICESFFVRFLRFNLKTAPLLGCGFLLTGHTMFVTNLIKDVAHSIVKFLGGIGMKVLTMFGNQMSTHVTI